jgi:PmbA protein
MFGTGNGNVNGTETGPEPPQTTKQTSTPTGKDKMNPVKAIDLIPEEIQLDLDIAHKVIKLAESLGAGIAEVYMVKSVDTGFSIENDMVTFSQSSTEFGMGIRVLKDKRLGFGYCTTLASAEIAIKNAISATKLAKQQDFEFNTKTGFRPISSTYDKTVLELTVTEGLDFTDQLIESSKEVESNVIVTGGGVGYGGGSVGIVNSNDVELAYSGTGIFGGVSTILKDKSISTGFEYGHSRKNDLDFIQIGKIASDLAVKGQNPKPVDGGNYSVIFTPYAFAELLEFTVIPGLYGEQASKGETPYSNKIGEEVACPEFTFSDDGTLDNGINTAPIDDEGTATQKNMLVDSGVLKGYLYDRLSALEFNEESTGNALRTEGFSSSRSYKALPKTKAFNFTIEGRTKPLDNLINELDNALVIHQLLGAHTANTASGDLSVNAPMLFKIENGSISSPGKQVMLSGNVPEMMRKISGIGNDYKDIGGGLTPVAQRVPSVVIENVKII